MMLRSATAITLCGLLACGQTDSDFSGSTDGGAAGHSSGGNAGSGTGGVAGAGIGGLLDDWYVAFAFCVWEGGRLPTEAEWEYAGAGGDEDRMFPYGPYEEPVDEFSCASDNLQTDCFGLGEAVRGYGRWGHMDLAGSVGEWVLDEYAPYSGAECVDCAPFTSDHVVRLRRGGSWGSLAEYTRAAWRDGVDLDFPTSGSTGSGFRCARSP
jgi:formylglycine-generating enzyme required for sulfatase activity